jgi:hypothetical protein
MRMMVVLFWMTYNLCSGHLIMLYKIPLQVMARKHVMFLRVSMLLSKYKSTAVQGGDMEVFSVAYVSGSIARQVLRDVSCNACKTCLTFEVLLRTGVFILFKEYSDAEQSLTYPSEKLVETVGAAVTLMKSVMTEVAHLNSVEQYITATINNSIDFEWIKCTGCLLHHQ